MYKKFWMQIPEIGTYLIRRKSYLKSIKSWPGLRKAFSSKRKWHIIRSMMKQIWSNYPKTPEEPEDSPGFISTRALYTSVWAYSCLNLMNWTLSIRKSCPIMMSQQSQSWSSIIAIKLSNFKTRRRSNQRVPPPLIVLTKGFSWMKRVPSPFFPVSLSYEYTREGIEWWSFLNPKLGESITKQDYFPSVRGTP